MFMPGRPRPGAPLRPPRRRGPAIGPRLDALEQRVVPATFTVDTFLDTPDAKLGDGLAADAAGHTSLRAAVMESNATPEADVIVLGGGTYALTRAGAGEDLALTGDLDVTGSLTVLGASSATTTVD